MAKSQQSFNKKEKEKKRLKKRQDKLVKKDERKASSVGGSLENMMAYVDEFGNITATPPDPTIKKKVIKASDIEIGIPRKEAEENAGPLTGKVDYFDSSKGFGFIINSKTQEKHFVHVSGLKDEVKEGDKVTFELEKGLKGMNAVRVKKI
ncbi:MAG: DNA-binding protein [Flavobacteriales bacterium CG_4_10_14_0_2_um_filter_32_8]|nr:MAG: DNA-binding protein [Flavobacteriales bacterium CG_4_10_14_0_2_um_filter_32_8]PJB15339.1 MAG: DNA-binding protein [Flavobacteriales bacterium CG_4_9_14_3_um_filter_32_8]